MFNKKPAGKRPKPAKQPPQPTAMVMPKPLVTTVTFCGATKWLPSDRYAVCRLKKGHEKQHEDGAIAWQPRAGDNR